MNPVETSKTENLQADIVVIGGGGAGLAAALAAAEKGVNKVIVLEKRRRPGGNGVFPVGIFGAESPPQRRFYINARRDELFKQQMSYTHWTVNPRIVRALVNKSGDTIRWLEEKGLKFDRVIPMYPNQISPTFHFRSGPGTTGGAITKALIKGCEELGVQLLCQTVPKRILTGEKGIPTGVLAATNGKELRITAKSVIIATGGLTGNEALLKKYVPSYSEERICHIGILNNGDGIRMAAEIGAVTEDMVTLEMLGPSFLRLNSHLATIARRPNTIWVNKKGERFTDETVGFFWTEGANTVYGQPEGISYTLFDERIKQRIIEEGLTFMEEIITGGGAWLAGVDKDIQLQVDKGRVKISDSWDEIARWIGADPKVLKATIDEYNSCCDRGYDDIFLKDRGYLLPLRTPPYYAMQCCVNLITTHGGIKVNHHMEVLNHQDSPIGGLYAAGNDTGGTDAQTYNLILTGHSFGFAVNSGRIAGETAAKYVLGK